MRDSSRWSVSLGRLAGVELRIHVTLCGLLALWGVREASSAAVWSAWYSIAAIVVWLVSLAAHELAHVLAAARVNGTVDAWVLSPWGGLTWPKVAHRPRPERGVAVAGPLAHLAIAAVASVVLAAAGRAAAISLNPLSPPAAGSTPGWHEVMQLIVWLNWTLALVNLLPAYPFDGGRICQSLFWQWVGFRSSVLRTAQIAKAIALSMGVLAYAVRDQYPWGWAGLMVLALVVYFASRDEEERLTRTSRADEGADLELAGALANTSPVQEPLGRPRRAGAMRQWLAQRRARRQALAREREAEEERRLDEVLARLHDAGPHALSDEDRLLLERVSNRYRSRQRS